MRGGLWRRADPFFSLLVMFSLVTHAGLAVALASVPPPPELDLAASPERLARWMPAFPLFKPPPRPVQNTAAPSTKPAAAAAATPAQRAQRIHLNVMQTIGPGTVIGSIFQSEGPAARLAEQLHGAAGVDVDAARAPQGPRGQDGNSTASIQAPGVPQGKGKTPLLAPRGPVEVKARMEEDGMPELDGGKLDPRAVARTIRSRMAGFRSCYENALKRTAQLAGKITLDFTIEEDGRVSEADIDVDTVGDQEMARCLVGLVKRIRFPSPENGNVRASFPFVFVRVD